MQPIIKPANRLQALPIPRYVYIGLLKSTAASANVHLVKSDAANKLAAYLGYKVGRYIKMHWKTTNTPRG